MIINELATTTPIQINKVNRISGTVGIRAQGGVFMCQRVRGEPGTGERVVHAGTEVDDVWYGAAVCDRY